MDMWKAIHRAEEVNSSVQLNLIYGLVWVESRPSSSGRSWAWPGVRLKIPVRCSLMGTSLMLTLTPEVSFQVEARCGQEPRLLLDPMSEKDAPQPRVLPH